MGYKRVGSFEKLEVIDLTRDGVGTVTKGKLVDHREFPSTIQAGKMAQVYTLEQEDGVKRQFYGSTALDSRLPLIELGSEIEIVYLGTEPAKNPKMNPWKNFDIFEVDPSYEGDDRKETKANGTGNGTNGDKKKKPF